MQQFDVDKSGDGTGSGVKPCPTVVKTFRRLLMRDCVFFLLCEPESFRNFGLCRTCQWDTVTGSGSGDYCKLRQDSDATGPYRTFNLTLGFP